MFEIKLSFVCFDLEAGYKPTFICYMHKYYVGFEGTLTAEKNIESLLRMRNWQQKNNGK